MRKVSKRRKQKALPNDKIVSFRVNRLELKYLEAVAFKYLPDIPERGRVGAWLRYSSMYHWQKDYILNQSQKGKK